MRDPDGVNLAEGAEDYPSQLEPLGSHYADDDLQASTVTSPLENTCNEAEEVRNGFIDKTAYDIKKLVGTPPPPPKGSPPMSRMNRDNKSDQNDMSSSVLQENDNEDSRDDCNVNTFIDDTKMVCEQNDARDTRESLVAVNQENLDTETVPEVSLNVASQEEKEKKICSPKSKTKDKKRSKKRGFFKKLFKGGKNREDVFFDANTHQDAEPESKAKEDINALSSSSNVAAEEVSGDKVNEIEVSVSTNIQESETEIQGLSLDPPDIDGGEESKDSEPPNSEETSLQIEINVVASKDPVGASPVAQSPVAQDDDTVGINIIQSMSGDPQGETPKARSYIDNSSNDPVGESFCHASRATKLSLVNEVTKPGIDDSSLHFIEKSIPGNCQDEIEDLNNQKPISSEKYLSISEQFKKSGFETVSNNNSETKKPLTVSAAAFTNAKAMAYLHRLEGEPSPRHTWHSKKSIPPPLAEKSIALAKIRAFSSKRKKATIENVTKMKGPSPDDYSATNSEVEAMMKEKNYVNHDPSKQFAPYSRFKGRRPQLRNTEKLDNITSPREMPVVPVLEVVEPTIDLNSIVPSGKLAELAMVRGTRLRQIKRQEESGTEHLPCAITTNGKVSMGGNRFNFVRTDESEIKDPVRRAGRRLLSKAAIPIQAGVRMSLSRREAMDRMWALIRIQSYFRRWKCEAILYKNKRSTMLVQKVYRGYTSRKELKNRQSCATLIQKIVRGYLTCLHAYETMYYVTRAQALARGFLVRTSIAREESARKAREEATVVIQQYCRDYLSRKYIALIKNKSATTIQSVWRSFASRLHFKLDVLDIITVQSIVRRRAAIRTADLIKKSSDPSAIISATKIQAAWRGYQAYTDFVFAIVDILIVQRTARQWLAVQRANQLRQERAALVKIQSLARRFLVKGIVEARRKEHNESMSIQRRKDFAATTIQKSWRGFWEYSHFVIVRYETTRIQALLRGKLARDRYQLKLGCAILIQAASRRFLARKAISSKVVDGAIVAARALELRERNSAKHIQFWWRIVLDWMKEKRAALVIERFFIFVKTEVERELLKQEQQRIKSEKIRKKQKKVPKLDPNWGMGNNAFAPHVVKKNKQNPNAPRSRPYQRNVPVNDINHFRSFQNRDNHGFLETNDMQSPPDMLQLAPSEDISMISNLTNPTVLNQMAKDLHQNATCGQTKSEELYQEVRARSKNEKPRRLSTQDYIKKYSGLNTAPNKSLSKSQSQHFFSDDRESGNRRKKRQSYDGTSLAHTRRQNSATSPGKGPGRYEKPMPHSTKAQKKDCETVERLSATTPRSSLGGYRSSSTPRNSSRSRRDTTSPSLLPPTPTRKKSAAILRSTTAVTECSTPVEYEKMYIPPRPRLSPRKPSPRKQTSLYGRGSKSVMIMKTTPTFMDDRTVEEAHEIMLLGDDYGEV